jgi:hypothetical protein
LYSNSPFRPLRVDGKAFNGKATFGFLICHPCDHPSAQMAEDRRDSN